MPNFEPVILEGRAYRIRHIGPQAALWSGNPPVAITAYTLLNQTTMVARPLPMANTPNTPDWVSGQWIGRLDDAGEFTLTFPNKEASDGQPWRLRFDPTGKNQWIEIYNDEYLEGVYCIQKVDIKQDQVVISGNDGWYQLKSAYERDWVIVQAPRDVIERGTKVWALVVADDFPPGVLNAQWTNNSAGGPTISIGPTGELALTLGTVGQAILDSQVITVPATGAWSSTYTFSSAQFLASGGANARLRITESNGDTYYVQVVAQGAAGVLVQFLTGLSGNAVYQLTLPTAGSYNLRLESDEEWVAAFVNGALVGMLRRITPTTTSIQTEIWVNTGITAGLTMLIPSIITKALVPFLMAGVDKGDYVLPGTTSTYPTGGLHARYFNDLDLQSDTFRLYKIHAPHRTQAYGGSGGSEYANQQDLVINGQANPLPGAATSSWSAVWFGAIYLKLSAGDYNVSFTVNAGQAIRAWIGRTKFGTQLLDQWSFAGANTYTITVSASTIAGTLPYGGSPVQRDGWYPIKIETAVDTTAHPAPIMKFTNTPSAYTDPGGTAIVSGAQTTVVPATSLSPLGCVDQRYQGISHFDLVQKTAQAFGYQISCEPYQLETLGLINQPGHFPGALAPRVREGNDTDAILEPDISFRTDGEGLIGYGNLLDATDSCTSLQGNGAGFQNGSTGQLQSEVFDVPTLQAALFELQAWQDFSDASFSSLLTALLNSEIGLRLTPWQTVTGQPMGKPRLAYAWPLPSALAQMRWRPGDGLRVQARDISLYDLTPRQLLVVTRSIHPNGATGTQVNFAARPRSPAHTQKRQQFSASRWQRNYQRQMVTLQSDVSAFIVSGGNLLAGAFSAYFGVALLPADQVVKARVRLAFSSGTAGLEINTVDVTTNLGGSWTGTPVNIDVTAYIVTAPNDGRVYCRIINKGAGTAQFQPQLLIDVLR